MPTYKRSKRKLKPMKSRIVVFREKHGDRYFDASTEKKYEAACIKIVKERQLDGWYSAYKPGYPEILTKKDADKLPPSYRKTAIDQLKYFETRMHEYMRDKEIARLAKRVIDNMAASGEAIYIIEARQEYQYEEFKFEVLEKA